MTPEAPTIEFPVGEEVTIVLENRTDQHSPMRGSHDFPVIAESDDLLTGIATGGAARHLEL